MIINKINKILNSGLTPIIIKLHTDLTEEESYKKESEIIKKIGRIDIKTGTLVNLNDGGTGGGSNLSEETKYKIGSSTRGKTYEEIYGIKKSIEMKEKRIFSNKNRNIHKEIDRSEIKSVTEKYLEITVKTKYNSIWTLYSPNNDVYITRNLLRMCHDLKISRSYISKLGRGVIRHYNNWKVEKKEFNDIKIDKTIYLYS